MTAGSRQVPGALCGASDTSRVYSKWVWGSSAAAGPDSCTRIRAPEAAILARYNPEYFWNEYLPAAGAPGGNVDLDWLDRRHAPMLALLGLAAGTAAAAYSSYGLHRNMHGRYLLDTGVVGLCLLTTPALLAGRRVSNAGSATALLALCCGLHAFSLMFLLEKYFG